MYVVGTGNRRHMPSCGVTRKPTVTITVPAIHASTLLTSVYELPYLIIFMQ